MPRACAYLLTWLCLPPILALLSGCGGPPAPTITAQGGDLVIHHQLDLFKLLAGTRTMFRDEAVFRFTRDPATGELLLSHDPQTQVGSERLHAFMRQPADGMPVVHCVRESHPAECPAADQAWRVTVESHWFHEFLGPLDARTEYLIAAADPSGVLFQPVAEDASQLNDTAYTWMNHSRVLPLGPGGGAATDLQPAAVGEFAQDARERVEFLQQEVPALGDTWRNALIDLADE